MTIGISPRRYSTAPACRESSCAARDERWRRSGPPTYARSGSSCRLLTDQVFIYGVRVVVRRGHRFDVDPGQCDPIQRQVETLRGASLHEQARAIRMEPGLDHVLIFEELRREGLRARAPDEDLHRVLLNLVAHGLDLALGQDVPSVQANHL